MCQSSFGCPDRMNLSSRLLNRANFPFKNNAKLRSNFSLFSFGLGAGLTSALVAYQFMPCVSAEPNSETDESLSEALSEKHVRKQKKVLMEMRNDAINREEVPIYRIVLTGGPCGGKSTAVATISKRLLSLGFRVFRVPEAATLLLTGSGVNPGTLSEHERQVFEATIIKTKIALEDQFYNLARAGNQPCVIICDRGTMDTAAYMDEGSFHVLLDEEKWNLVDLRDKRYDAIIHLVTAAIGAEKYYTTENNAVRSENLQQARDLDFKVLNAWVGHPRIRIVDNSTDFQSKIARIEQIICQVVGAPRPVHSERKFIVDNDISSEAIANSKLKIEKFSIEQTYLAPRSDSAENFGYNYVVRRGQNGQYTYTHSMLRQDVDEKITTEDSEKVILDRSISGREYLALLKHSDDKRITIKKDVQFFIYNGVVYELQKFTEPDIGLTILKTEAPNNAKREIVFPWFLNIKGEVTGADEFASYNISQFYQKSDGGGKAEKYTWKDNQFLYEAYKKSNKDAKAFNNKM